MVEDRRDRLLASLRGRAGRLADIYAGAWCVLRDETNPDRIALAAHSMRELLEKGQRELVVGVASAGPGSGQTRPAFKRLEQMCQRAREESSSYRDRGGRIDEPVAGVLEAAEELVAIHNRERPGRAEQREDLIRRLDPLGTALPGEVVAGWLDRWDSWDKLFQLTAHHQITPSADELASAIDEVTAFLVDRLEPAPSKARDEIERLVREAERQ